MDAAGNYITLLPVWLALFIPRTNRPSAWPEYRAVLEVAQTRGDAVPLELWAHVTYCFLTCYSFAWRAVTISIKPTSLSFLAGRVGLKRGEP